MLRTGTSLEADTTLDTLDEGLAMTEEVLRDEKDDVDDVELLLPLEIGNGLWVLEATGIWPPLTVEEGG